MEQPHLSKITNITKWITLVGCKGLVWRQLVCCRSGGEWSHRDPSWMETQWQRPVCLALQRRTWGPDICQSGLCQHGGVAWWWCCGGGGSMHLLQTLPKSLHIKENNRICCGSWDFLSLTFKGVWKCPWKCSFETCLLPPSLSWYFTSLFHPEPPWTTTPIKCSLCTWVPVKGLCVTAHCYISC